MNKFLLLALLTAGTGAAQAQSIAAGTVSLGGSIGYSRSSTEGGIGTNKTEFTRSEFHFAPTVGYFATDNLAIGLHLGITSEVPSHLTSGNGSTDPEANTNWRVGSFVQYYKMFNEQFAVTGAIGAGYQQVEVDRYINSAGQIFSIKGSGFYAEITPGVVFFPVPKLGFSATIGSLGYSQFSNDLPGAPDDYENHSSTFGASFGLDQLQFGGTFYFGR